MTPPPATYDEGWFDWAYKGVDHTFPGNGGPECRDFLSLSQRCWESVAASIVGLCALLYAYPRLSLPVQCPSSYTRGEALGKRILLLLMCLTFGIELGFKFSTRQMIWIGNPCHLATMIQIFILAAPPSRIVTAAFRLHMHMLTGAPIAILFPVINTRLLPFETSVYFVQHILMLIIPFYLMKLGDPFIPEKLLDFKWSFMSFGFLYIYHFLPLQYLAYMSQVNLNNMLCPAVSDPFHGKYYRLFAICHQIILIPTLGKIFVIIAKGFNILPCNNLPDAPVSQVFCRTPPVCCPAIPTPSPSCESSNSSELHNCDSGISTCNCNQVNNAASKACETCNISSSSIRSAERNEEGRTEDAAETSRVNSTFAQQSPCDISPPRSSCESSKQGAGEGNACGQTFVTRTLVNGKVYPCKESAGGGARSDSLPSAYHRRRDFDGSGPMSMSELDDRNGHAKAH